MAPTVRILEAPVPPPLMDGRGDLGLPEELESRLRESPGAREAFSAWSLMQQWDVAWFIEESPDERTRLRRAMKARSVLEGRLALLGT
ncbi:MAG: YdeI/OmpD-associated family protein [Acidobacteria bacterium]|nr:YdeI/OmpD-associated family protein [Acidobacteriota bacterium]